jgi:hypothetical protein
MVFSAVRGVSLKSLKDNAVDKTTAGVVLRLQVRRSVTISI